MVDATTDGFSNDRNKLLSMEQQQHGVHHENPINTILRANVTKRRRPRRVRGHPRWIYDLHQRVHWYCTCPGCVASRIAREASLRGSPRARNSQPQHEATVITNQGGTAHPGQGG